MAKPEPKVVPMDSVPPIPKEQAPTKVKIARLITRERSGSSLLLGVCWMDPGEETNVWSFEDTDRTAVGETYYGPRDETYFIIRGHLELTWDQGALQMAPNDAVFLAPGWRYKLKNVGTEPAFFVYSMCPSPA